MLQKHFTADVESADNLSQTINQLRNHRYHLVLVNRILDKDGSEGLEVIRQIRQHPDLRDTPLMMITNYAEHQQLAQEVGALKGFGKQSIEAPETLARLQPLLR